MTMTHDDARCSGRSARLPPPGLGQTVSQHFTTATSRQAAQLVLHIGDHDPSGVSMFLAFLEDVEAFTRELGGQATFTRLAVTPQQMVEYRLPTAPPKVPDNRAFSGETCQAE